jgi:hypothetical protein
VYETIEPQQVGHIPANAVQVTLILSIVVYALFLVLYLPFYLLSLILTPYGAVMVLVGVAFTGGTTAIPS